MPTLLVSRRACACHAITISAATRSEQLLAYWWMRWLSNRVVAVTDGELLFVEMQHLRYIVSHRSHTWCVESSRQVVWYLHGPVPTVILVVNALTRSKPLLSYRWMRSVVAVTDEELFLVEMQHICRCRCYQSGIWCARMSRQKESNLFNLLCPDRVEYSMFSTGTRIRVRWVHGKQYVEYNEFLILGGWSNCKFP